MTPSGRRTAHYGGHRIWHTRLDLVTPADLARVLDRYVATGESAPALAAALGLDAADVAAVLAGAGWQALQ